MFSLSFLDAMTCGLGAVILLFMIINASIDERREVVLEELASEVDREQVVRNLENHPWVRHADAALLLDGQLVIRIEEREPVALVRGPAVADKAFIWRLVDRTGTPFARTRAEDWSRLPRLRSRGTRLPSSARVRANRGPVRPTRLQLQPVPSTARPRTRPTAPLSSTALPCWPLPSAPPTLAPNR